MFIYVGTDTFARWQRLPGAVWSLWSSRE